MQTNVLCGYCFAALPVRGFETLLGNGVQQGDAFGSAISRDNTTLAVAAHLAADGIGKVYLFTQNTWGAWKQAGTLQPSYLLPGDSFGASLVVQNGLLLVGAPGDSKYQGTVYIFKGSGASWNRIGKLYPSDATAGDKFGSSVAMTDGGLLAVGATQSDRTGAVYIFESQETAGKFVQQLKISPNIELLSFFGSAVALTYQNLLVGAPFGMVNGTRSGAVYWYKREGRNSWSQQQFFSSTGKAYRSAHSRFS